MAAYRVLDNGGDDGRYDDELVTRTRFRLHAEEALREARVTTVGDDLQEFAGMLAVATRRHISAQEVTTWELGVGETMPADVLLAACYLAGHSVSELIGFGPKELERLESRLAKLEGQRARFN